VIGLEDVSLRRGSKLLFENATFQVHAGQRMGLVGANGSGKSSLFSMLMGQLESDHGEVRVSENALVSHVSQESPHSDESAIDYVQNGDAELRSLQERIRVAESDRDDGAVPALYERMEHIDGFAAEARAGRLLNGLGFSAADVSRPVREFSGGWRMRLNLAQALMCRSDVLLLDEPTNHLDLPAILWLERWLNHYPGILIVVSHDRDFLDAVCTRIAHIEHQQISVFSGNYSVFEKFRAERLAQQQSMYKRQQKEIKHIQSYVDRFRYKASKARQAQSRLKMLERMTEIAPAHVDSPFHFQFLEPERQPHQLVLLESVSAGYTEPVLRDVKLQISAGDRLGLLGVNGAGKSTLVKALADASTLLKGERTISKDTRIGYFAQHQLDLLDPERSPAEHLRALDPGERESDLRRYLGGFGFGGERIFEPLAPFSGGEKARLVLALIIRQRPNLLLLDEPTNHLDLEMRQALSHALMEFSGAILVISHDRHLLRSVCDDLLVVHDGSLEHFNRSIDEYPAWLKEQEENAAPEPSAGENPAGSAASRKQQRQIEAEQRRRLQPLRNDVRRIESRMETLRKNLLDVERTLSDPSLYGDDGRKEELTGLLKQQAGLRAELEESESLWLEASEKLEQSAP
jgi:ATP-binding cassette subfamily F protein 3